MMVSNMVHQRMKILLVLHSLKTLEYKNVVEQYFLTKSVLHSLKTLEYKNPLLFDNSSNWFYIHLKL